MIKQGDLLQQASCVQGVLTVSVLNKRFHCSFVPRCSYMHTFMLEVE